MDRIIIIYWNKNTGPEPIIQYPPEKKFPSKDLFLKIWALHELDKESSIIEYIPEIGNEQYTSIIQEFEGELYFLVIVYDETDKIKDIIVDYPDILAIVSKNLIELINSNKITRAISEAFTTIKNFSKLEKEENLLTFFKDRIKSTILKILQDGVISKSSLNDRLRQEYGFSTLNLDLLLISFIRENLIIKKNVPGAKECYFLINDLSCIRIPPTMLPNKPENDTDAKLSFNNKVNDFFAGYDVISEKEKKDIIKFLIYPEIHNILEKLREGSVSVSECLEILNNKEELFSELLSKHFVFESKGYVSLLSDIRFIKFKPYYVIKKLFDRYEKHEISFDQYTQHLKLLLNGFKNDTELTDYEIV
ncbi:MAG: hypothetical protein GF353_24465 [Candidatus Lokiarchaeota archaeon]|nr:hypothetical protein [Candidatus Lokiarchaeota archaeon]